MIYCTKCGTQFEGRFCPSCGTSAESGAAGSPPVPPPVSVPAVSGIPANVASMLCYLVPLAGPIIFLLLPPYNGDRKIRFDAWQAIFLDVAFIAAGLVVNILSDISWHLHYALSQMVNLAFAVIVVFMAVKAYQTQKVVLPYIGPLAEKQK